ncbi:MAG: L,D-transpeptidase scaffold domain-containing protein [Erythrobacter sp.]
MTKYLSRLAGSAAVLALAAGAAGAAAGGALAQERTRPPMIPGGENWTGPAQVEMPKAEKPAPETPAPKAKTGDAFNEAFPDMVSEPVVQEGMETIYPLVQSWSLDQAAALIAVIEQIAAEGLDPADYELAALKVALASGPSQELDEIASQAFVWLVEDLRDGRTPMDARTQWFVVDPDRERFPTGKLLADAVASGDIAATLAQLAPTHPDYARLRAELANTPKTNSAKRRLIKANMDRWRWLPRDLGPQYLITNVPEYQLRLTVNNTIISTYRTIVGKPGRSATPQLAETIEGVVFNPTWTVPQSIVKGEGLGERALANPAWARRNGYVATRGANGFITVVQQPGPGNSLGLMKLEMPNPHAIFFHDTPSRHLFANADRALSHGCIRTERALELAITMAILGKGATKEEAVEIANSGKYTKVPIEKRMPAYITYFTMASDINGNMATFKDIYDRDAPVLASFDKPRVRERSILPTDEVIVIEDDLRDG